MSKKSLIYITISVFILLAFIQTSKVPATVHLKFQSYYVSVGTYDPSGVAFGYYDSSYEKIGWDTLSLSTSTSNGLYSDYEKAYALGYLEGVLTYARIYDIYVDNYQMNFYYEPNRKMNGYMIDFFNKQREWVRNSYISNQNDSYWQNAWALQQQLEGLMDGYNFMVSDDKKISYAEFHVVASGGDIDDVILIDPSHRPNYTAMNHEEIAKTMDLRLHCSALIKLSANYSDVYFGHNTWSNYVNMIRIFKEYSIHFETIPVKTNAVMFSSYPGTLGSIDDYYVTSSKLAVIETTNSIFENSLYDKIVPESLLYWHRVQISNRMTDNGRDWTTIFSKYNSGTYNNQNMVLDLKKIDTINGVVADETLWIAEQIPRTIISSDVTDVLRYGYWPSYNVPYFKEIRILSGVDKYNQLHPELRKFYDYHHCARANIFRRDQGKIQSYEDFKMIFRYNDYLHDPLSLNNPKLSIASRNDLNLTQFNCTGAIDAKTSCLSKIVTGNASISYIAGPTYVNQPAFQWSQANCIKDPRYLFQGMPDKFEFKWEEFVPMFFTSEKKQEMNA